MSPSLSPFLHQHACNWTWFSPLLIHLQIILTNSSIINIPIDWWFLHQLWHQLQQQHHYWYWKQHQYWYHHWHCQQNPHHCQHQLEQHPEITLLLTMPTFITFFCSPVLLPCMSSTDFWAKQQQFNMKMKATIRTNWDVIGTKLTKAIPSQRFVIMATGEQVYPATATGRTTKKLEEFMTMFPPKNWT